MKHILPLFFILLMSVGAIAQIQFTPDVMSQDTTLDLSDVWSSTKMHAELHNNGNTDAILRWEIVQIDGPTEWQTQLCVDANFGGCFAWGALSNISPMYNTDIALEVVPGGSSLWDLGLKPNGVGGCGTFEVRVTDTADLTTVLSFSTHTFRVNVDANCDVVSSVSGLDKKALKLHPNPTTNYFTLTENDFVEEIQIFSIVGKRMDVMPFQNGNAINVSSYPNGLYLVRMLDKDGEILKTTRLIKR